MDIIAVPLLLLIKGVCSLLALVVIADVILSFLVTWSILNTDNQIVWSLVDSIRRISDFMCDPIRKRFPVLVGTLDFSPIIVIMFVSFLEHVIARILMRIG